jgi:class 3 adenylate cyclase/Tfp pilus assembly protein PilF
VALCPSCGRENPQGFQFCGFCTAPLTAHPAAPALQERKVVSVLFCDLVGFTAASEAVDPEDVQARLGPYHERVRGVLERHGGTVEKFVGDAVMAVFGAPLAHEDDAERAVRAGLGILEAIAELNEGEPGFGLQVRVGLNTGEAVVALGARPEQGEGFVTGDVVNTASRLQGVAPVNGVAVSEATYRVTERIFDYEPLESVSVKGKGERLAIYRPLRPRARFGSDVTRTHATPLVGRELEKPLLIGTFERAAQQQSCQLVTLVGEPGVGKSRLCAELFGYVEERPGLVRWRQGRCLPYGEGIAFWALGEIVKAEAGILESDSPRAALEKLRAAIPDNAGDPQWLVQRVAALVGADAGAPAEREELFTAWRRFFEGLAAAHPTVLVFEDLHWGDDALLAFLEYLAEWSRNVPLLMVCAARPELYERRPNWGAGLRNTQTINLNPLSDDETAELVSYLSRSIELSKQLERAVLERAGGNPLYAEEFVRFLADREVDSPEQLLDDAALPDTVQALIAARLDTLPQERKSLLQDAAVVGNVFWAGALADIGGENEDTLEIALHELTQKELVRPSRTTSMEGESEYLFWHILIRDVAYAQIPRADRARRHRAAAKWIEGKAGERVEDLGEVLAHHYLQAIELFEAASEPEEAAALAPPARRFLALAGERALGLDAAQAESRFARALELTPRDDPEREGVVARWAEAVYQAGRLGEAAAALDGILDSLRASGRTEATAAALQLRSRLAQRLGQGHRLRLAAEAVQLLEQRPPGQALVDAYAQLASSHHLNGEYEDAIAAADRACELAQTLGLSEPARALGYRGYARASLGDKKGLDEMEYALSLLIDAGVGADAGILQNNLAIARYPLQGPARSLAAFEEGIAFCEERGLVAIALFLGANCPGLLAELGRPEEAKQRAAALIAALEGTGSAQDPCEVHASELAVRLAQGMDSASNEVESLIATTRTVGNVDVTVLGLAVAAAARVAEDPREACLLLDELEHFPGVRGSSYYARQLPRMIRTALLAGDGALARRLTQGIEPRYPLETHALRAAQAQLAEYDGHTAAAAALYAQAADGWCEFGNVPEHAYALLGQSRTLTNLGKRDAEQPLRQARDLLTTLAYKPALDETSKLLAQHQLAAS